MKQSNYRRTSLLGALLLLVLLAFTGCGGGEAAEEPAAQPAAEEYSVSVVDTAGNAQDIDLSKLYAEEENVFSHLYSTINNWPTKSCNAAKGIKVSAIPGLAPEDAFETVTFLSDDGYKVTLTKEQLYCDRFYYPNLETDEETGKEPVEPIIAMEYKEDSTDLSEILQGKPALMLGQSNIYEHNTIAGVEDLSEIILSAEPAEQWEAATCYPEAGEIYAGDKVKLEHSGAGAFAKIFYTTDGTDPTVCSKMYNPSTYQPELNAPIEITEDTVIKVLVSGYGKRDSEIVTYEFRVK